jgi:hypothetical protein
MLFARSFLLTQLSEVQERIQRLEAESTSLRIQIAEDAARRTAIAQVEHTASGSVVNSDAEHCARATIPSKSSKRGRAGGLARAIQALRLGERWPNGRFMAHEDWEQIERDVAEAAYMRYAAGGFARAAKAKRQTNGTFATEV